MSAQRPRAPEPQHEPRAVPYFRRRSGERRFHTFGVISLKHEQARKVVAASSVHAVRAVAQAVQRSHSLRPVAFDCFGGFHSACEAGLRHAANCKIVYREQAPSLNAVAGKTR